MKSFRGTLTANGVLVLPRVVGVISVVGSPKRYYFGSLETPAGSGAGLGTNRTCVLDIEGGELLKVRIGEVAVSERSAGSLATFKSTGRPLPRS
jgi:hypothetical protein